MSWLFSRRINNTRLWRILHHYVDEARDKADYSDIRNVGMDETSRRRGHNYVSLFVDLDTPKVLFVTEGKDAATVERFKQDLTDHNGNPEAIEEMCSDMSPSFISGVEKYFPNAHLTFDKFHIMKVINARARGYRTTRNIVTIIYLIAGKLNFGLPTWNSEEPNSENKRFYIPVSLMYYM